MVEAGLGVVFFGVFRKFGQNTEKQKLAKIGLAKVGHDRRTQHANMCGLSGPLRSSAARERVLPVVKMKLRKPSFKKTFYLLQALRTVGATRVRLEKVAADCSHTSCWPCDDPIFITPSSVRRLGSLCLWDRNQTTGETNCCIVQVTSKDILDRNACFLCKVGTSWCKTFCPPLRNVMTWPFQKSKNICESETSMGSKSSSIKVSTNWVTSASNIFELVLRQGPSG